MPLVILEHGADRGATQRGDSVEHVGRLDTVSGQLIALDVNSQHRQAAGRGGLDVARTVDSHQNALDFACQPSQYFQIRPLNEHGHVALDAGD